MLNDMSDGRTIEILLNNDAEHDKRITNFLDAEYDAGRIGGWFQPTPGVPSVRDRCPVPWTTASAAARPEPRAVAALREMILLVDDMMPNVAKGVVQDYQRLNEAPIEASAIVREFDERR